MILAVNTGSSSIKLKLFECHKGKILEIASFSSPDIPDRKISNFSYAYDRLVKLNRLDTKEIKRIVYRIVHGGNEGKNGSVIDQKVLKIIQKYSHLSPNHNPYAHSIILRSKKIFKEAEHYAFFDTAYFSKIPEASYNYPLGIGKIKNIEVRKYGFHGLSHQYMYEKTAKGKKAITIHLGAGCSLSAISKEGPIDTSMGMTPLAGTIMLARPGNVDPGIILELAKRYGIKKSYDILSKKSGLKAMTHRTNNMLDILFQAFGYIEGDDALLSDDLPTDKKSSDMARVAIERFVLSVQKYICEYYIKLGGCDFIVFSGKIGHGSKKIRNLIMEDLKFLNVKNIETVKTNEEKMMVSLLIN